MTNHQVPGKYKALFPIRIISIPTLDNFHSNFARIALTSERPQQSYSLLTWRIFAASRYLLLIYSF